jgi:hypothetical protein
MTIARVGLLVLGVLSLACHRAPPARRTAGVRADVKDTVVVKNATIVQDSAGVVPFFKDTALVTTASNARTFNLRTAGQRDSLREVIRKERELWRARRPQNYRFLLRVECFCPGQLGWLLMDVRSGKLVRAWDKRGRAVAITNWNTLSIDGLFDNLEGSVDRYGSVQITFDPRWHFPGYLSTAALLGPDSWGIIQARGFRPT